MVARLVEAVRETYSGDGCAFRARIERPPILPTRGARRVPIDSSEDGNPLAPLQRHTNAGRASALSIGPQTTKNHASGIIKKPGVEERRPFAEATLADIVLRRRAEEGSTEGRADKRARDKRSETRRKRRFAGYAGSRPDAATTAPHSALLHVAVRRRRMGEQREMGGAGRSRSLVLRSASGRRRPGPWRGHGESLFGSPGAKRRRYLWRFVGLSSIFSIREAGRTVAYTVLIAAEAPYARGRQPGCVPEPRAVFGPVVRGVRPHS